jgi:hypothetical protein
MTRLQTRQLKQSLKASCIALYILANVAGLMALGNDWSPQDNVASHLCVGHLSLMTNVMPDIHC